MRKALKIITIVLAAIGAFYLLLIAFLSTNGFSDKTCSSETIKSIKSQNHKYAAALIYQKCPPESHISAFIIIRGKNKKSTKLIFDVLSHTPGSLAKNIKINFKINLNWIDGRTLLVEYPKSTIVTFKSHSYNDVNIIYNEKNR